MGDNHSPNSAGPTGRERARALHEHNGLFEETADHPQIGVHETFLKQWAVVNAYVEGEVFRCWRSFETFIHGDLESEASSPVELKLAQVMDPLISNLLLHARVTKDFQRMTQCPSPWAPFMDLYRHHGRVEEQDMRAANGEMASRYGKAEERVPPNLGVIYRKDLDPMAKFLLYWVYSPIYAYFVTPSKELLHHLLPMYRAKESDQKYEGFAIRGTLEAFANALVYVLVTLILVAPIATFNVVESQTVRIAVMPIFFLLLVASAQHMGSKSWRVATLATGYFQAMVIYVSTTSGRQAS